MGIEKVLEVFVVVDRVHLVLLLVLQVLQLDCIDQVNDLSTVSGFYGPGAYIAWILTFTSTLTSHETNLSVFKPFRQVFQWHQRPGTDEAVDIQPSPIGSNFIASVAFPLIACIDYIKRSRAGIFDRQLDAAACVAHISTLFTFVALCGFPLQYHVRKLGNYNFTKLAKIRFLALYTLWSISTTTTYYHYAVRWTNPYISIRILFAFTIGFSVGMVLATYYKWSVVFVVCFCLVLAQFNDFFSEQPRPCVLRVQFPFPQTASKLGDLDQAAALATGLAVFMYPILRATTRIIWRLLDTPQNPSNTNQPTLSH